MKAKRTTKKGKDEGKAKRGELLDEILDEIGGEDGAQLLGSEGLAIKIRGVISTQCPGIDWATGRGGIPLGRLTILHGAEGSGKTTLALHIVAECQRENGIAIYLDKEYKLDPDYAQAIGVDTKRLLIIQPPHLERVFETAHRVIKKASEHRERTGQRTPILLVLDSMNAAITKAQLEGKWEDKHVSPQARVFSELLPKLIPEIHKEDVGLLFVSQVRKKINLKFGNPDKIAGGEAPRFFASMIIKVTNVGSNKEDGEKVSNKLHVECVKNQIAPPFKKAECEVSYGQGIDREKSLLWLAEKRGIVEKSAAWFSYSGERLGHGADSAAQKLRESTELHKKILEQTRKACGWG